MRKQAGIGYVLQTLLFLAALVAPYYVVGDHKFLGYVNDQSVVSICLLVFGLLQSVAVTAYLFSKAEIRNDGRVVVIISQAAVSALMLVDGAFIIYGLTMLPFFLAFRFWRSP
jgi:hypothetical protein